MMILLNILNLKSEYLISVQNKICFLNIIIDIKIFLNRYENCNKVQFDVIKWLRLEDGMLVKYMETGGKVAVK